MSEAYKIMNYSKPSILSEVNCQENAQKELSNEYLFFSRLCGGLITSSFLEDLLDE